MTQEHFKVTLVYANTAESIERKVDGTTNGSALLAFAYTELGKTPQPGDLFEIHDQTVDPSKTVADYAAEFGKQKKELVFEITNPTGGA